ncbi:MAG TPA: outer membrane lipoprotein carrier protein LolA [Verrucomicrobiae bacterium]|nr:outer membrane lipoprotein carrier protein LolA [Verrucomicrobiae bacterium]
MKILAVMVALTLSSFLSVAAAETPADPGVLQALQKKMASVHSVYLEFTQERVLKLFAEPLKSDGVMLIERPDRIRWETTSPYQTILLGDHNSVAQFEFAEGKWDKLKLGFPQLLQRVMQQMSAMNQGKLEAMTADYEISAATNKDETVLTMVPKDKNVREMMSSLEIHLPPDLSGTREVVMNEPNGDLTRIVFRQERHNVTFPAGTFDQAKPLPIAAVKAAVTHGS